MHPIRWDGHTRMSDDQTKRRIISRLMREAASIFSESSSSDLAPALPKMRAAVLLAEQLGDKAPLLICQANLAWMSAVCGRAHDAMTHIERAIDAAIEHDLPIAVRNFAFTKFVEICILLQRDPDRALTYSRALVQSALDEEGSYEQFLASLFNLSIVCQELLRTQDEAVAVLSWICDEGRPSDHPIVEQAKKAYGRIVNNHPPETRHTWLSELEANRDELLSSATDGFLPKYGPEAK